MSGKGWKRWGYAGAVALLLAAGVAARIYGAWVSRVITDPDCGIVGLMARHVAQGGPWPVFFYGQAYMGSLEPLLSAALCRLFGTSGFMVCLGTALAACATLPLIFLLAREMGGRAGGLAALALCCVGPRYYFAFQFAPRGGYMVALFAALLVLYLGARISAAAAAAARGAMPAAGTFLALGIAAGAGWWSNPLVTPALAATALVLAIGLRRRVFSAGVCCGAAGFFMGSAPFWVWNLRNAWASLRMTGNLGAVGWGAGARLLLERFERLVGLEAWPAGARWAVYALYGGLVTAGLALSVWAWRRRRWTRADACRTGVMLFLLFSLLVYVRSAFVRMNTARYFVPMVPAMAALAGVVVGRLAAGGHRLLAAVPVALLLVSQYPGCNATLNRKPRAARARHRYEVFGQFAASNRIEGVFSHFRHHALNFNLDEQVAVAGLGGDRYPPIAQAAEKADRVAVLGNYGRVSGFLRVSGGTARVERVAGYRVDFDFRPPAGGLRELEAGTLTAVLDTQGADHRAALTDRNIDSAWTGREGRDDGVTLLFSGVQTVRCVRVLSAQKDWRPRHVRVDVRTAPGGAWRARHDTHPFPGFWWSGPRPFWNGRRHRLDYRFNDEPMAALRLVGLWDPRCVHPWRIGEVQVFGPAPAVPAQAAALDELAALLEARGIRSLHADRWAANAVAARTDGRVAVEPAMDEAAFPSMPRDGSVSWRRDVGLLADVHDAPATRSTLERFGIRMRETAVGPWVLFDFDPALAAAAPPPPPPNTAPPVYWTGTALLTGHTRGYALGAMRAAARALRAGEDPRRVLERVLGAEQVYAGALSAGEVVVNGLRGRVPDEDWQALFTRYRALAVPPVALRAAYDVGVDAVGVAVRPERVTPGDTLRVAYYWRVSRLERERPAVFVHFLRDGIVFQDDHVLLAREPAWSNAGAWPAQILKEEREVTVPAHAPPGLYTIRLGLVDQRSGRRLPARGECRWRCREVRAQDVLRVVAPAAAAAPPPPPGAS